MSNDTQLIQTNLWQALPEFSQKEADAFRMKAISLLKSKGVFFGDFKALHKAPIITDKLAVNAPVFSCYQIISPFPGEIIVLTGFFKREGIPIPHHMEMMTRYQQTGFPHPSQHTGWALDKMLVEGTWAPREIVDRIKLLSEILSEEQSVKRAKESLKQKRHELGSEEFVALHRELAHAIVQSDAGVIDAFFDRMKKGHNVYERVSSVYETVNQAVFYDKVIASEEDDFVFCMAERLSPAVKNILENRVAGELENKLLLAAYKQVREFMAGVDLRSQLKSDIELFNS